MATKKRSKKKEARQEKQTPTENSQNNQKQTEKTQDKQLFWFFTIIVLVFFAFLGTYYIAPAIVKKMNSFEYVGVEWTKEKFDQLDVYHARYPIIYKGQFMNTYYNLYIRNDPRTNTVPINNVKFLFNPTIIRTIQPEVASCPGVMRLNADLYGFLSAFPMVKEIQFGIAEKQVAEESNLTYATCDNAKNGTTVVLIRKSEAPSIDQKGDCYTINVGNCEMGPAVEKFMIGVLAQLNNATLNAAPN